ncbi:hypothetical protein FB451DRAFT_1450941 [Mycena latifolia]|nr:hypothetical protein FB451DRAFT_1450941 [Mycena latifolia]
MDHAPHPLTILALKHFARHCPSLRWLCIPLTGHVLLAPVPVPHKSRPVQSALEKVYVAHSPIDSAFSVAAFLSSIFPHLVRIHIGQIPPGAREDHPRVKWKEVERLLPLVGAVHVQDQGGVMGLGDVDNM